MIQNILTKTSQTELFFIIFILRVQFCLNEVRSLKFSLLLIFVSTLRLIWISISQRQESAVSWRVSDVMAQVRKVQTCYY